MLHLARGHGKIRSCSPYQPKSWTRNVQLSIGAFHLLLLISSVFSEVRFDRTEFKDLQRVRP